MTACAGERENPCSNKELVGRKGKFMYVPWRNIAICVEFRPLAAPSVRLVSQDLGQPDSCEKANRWFGVEPAVCLMIPDFPVS
jgi:hypothetical protein